MTTPPSYTLENFDWNAPCTELFEFLLHQIDKPYDYNYILAKLLCRLLNASTASTIEYVDGVPMNYDTLRDKILSLPRPVILSGAYGSGITDRYLKLSGVPSAGSQGYLLPRKATITGLWGNSRSTGLWTLEVRKNNSAITLANVTINGGSGTNAIVNIDVNVNDTLQIFARGNGIQHINAKVEIAWRK